MKRYESWGRYPKSKPAQIIPLSSASEIPDLEQLGVPALVYGQGRSYGDCCLNNGGVLLDSSGLNRILLLDAHTGILRCEAGVTLQTILRVILPARWFLPVTPGTQFVTLGGAIANDVHGKNHHRAGSFGCHVLRFALARSDRKTIECSREENVDLFQATIGGLGLTGIILWAEIQLKPVSGPWIDCERIRFANLEEFFALSAESDGKFEYTVAWLDCAVTGKKLGRGIFLRGNHSEKRTNDSRPQRAARALPGIAAPEFLINRPAVRAFNWMYYHGQTGSVASKIVHYEKFFYPLDRVEEWNRFYGKRGFLQYQFVVPYENRGAVLEILKLIESSRQLCTLSVLKVFGTMRSPGLLSFPRPGVTLALDFPLRGRSTLELCERFDEVVRKNGGAVYPAKDARMSAESFGDYFPRWKEILPFLDPHFCSDFWRRVTTSSAAW